MARRTSFPFHPETGVTEEQYTQILALMGWFPGRAVEDWHIDGYQEECADYGLPWHAASVAFARSFGRLKLYVGFDHHAPSKDISLHYADARWGFKNDGAVLNQVMRAHGCPVQSRWHPQFTDLGAAVGVVVLVRGPSRFAPAP